MAAFVPIPTTGAARRERGFTLLEVLIAVTLLGLIFMLLFGGLRLGTRAWESHSGRVDEVTQLEISHQLIRRMLSQAYPLTGSDILMGSTGGRRIAFQGEPDGVNFTGLMPTQLGGGGFYRFDLRVSDDGETAQLVMRWRPITYDGDDNEDDAAGDETVLIERIAGATFWYFGAAERGESARWHQVWDDPVSLPALVRLEIDFPEGGRRFWPDLVVAPRIGAIGARMF